MCIDSKTSEIVSINPVRSQPNESVMETSDSDPLKLHQISGGSVVVHAPLFSSNEENLFVIWNNKIQCFNVTTGELLRDFDGLAEGSVLLGMKIHEDCLVACTDRGNVVTWKQKSGVIVSQVSLYESSTKVLTFDIITINNEVMILVHYKQSTRRGLELRRLHTGQLYQALDDPVSVRSSTLKISVGSADLQYFCFIQDYQLKMVQFNEQGRYRFNKLGNEYLTDFTVVACHPTEELVATGDQTGKILVIRNMFSNSRMVKQIYHWHASQVNALCWSTLGRNFYSGGNQCVLVKWTLDAPLEKDFYPRMPGALLHIATTAHSDNFAVSTSDNGIYMFKSNRLIGQIQNFTWISEDGTGLTKFPAGMRVNPRNTSLVLNGRAGHLQFYSPHTKSLLFNIDTTLQNHLSKESDAIIYNTRITNVALNLNWMATGEVWDDKEHNVELRLKFWAFDEQHQRYTLNTNVEFAHEGQITALEFSSLYHTDDLLCASAGNDNIIKIWSLEDSESIYRKGKVWTCIKQLAYKSQPASTLSFSQDGSLLAAGVGSSLCIWTMDDKFQMKCALTAPSALDGSASKVVSVVGSGQAKDLPTAKVQQEKQKKVLEQMKALLEKGDACVVKPAADKYRMVPKKQKPGRLLPRELSGKEKELVCRRIFGLNELNVSQKMSLCARLGVTCQIDDQLTEELLARHKREDIKKTLNRLSIDKKFEFKRRFANITRRRSTKDTVSLRKLLNFSGDFANVAKTVKLSNGNSFLHMNGHSPSNGVGKPQGQNGEKPTEDAPEEVTPVKNLAQIKHVLFGHGDYCHLVIVCTETRMLIWNLLTLRLQTAVKLSVQHIAIDSFTNVVAAFTKHKELYIFLPGTPIPLYNRRYMPNVEGIAWIPRRQPRSQSINVDWQATSQLYFITDKQELMCLTDKSDLETVAPSKFFGDAAQPLPKTPFAAMMAKQISNDREKTKSLLWSKVGTKEKEAVKEVMNLSNHAMPAVNRLCKDFLKTLLVVDRSDRVSTTTKPNGLQKLDDESSKNDSTPTIDDSDDEKADSSDVKRMLKTKQVDKALKANGGAEAVEADYFQMEKSLKKLATKDIKFNF